jgi:hypothetical protein
VEPVELDLAGRAVALLGHAHFRLSGHLLVLRPRVMP